MPFPGLMAPAAPHRDGLRGATCTVRGLELLVPECGALLPALPVLARHDGGPWEHVGDVIDRPEQLAGLARAPWTALTRLALRVGPDGVVLTGTAEPSGRAFALTAADPLGPWSALEWLDDPADGTAPEDLPVEVGTGEGPAARVEVDRFDAPRGPLRYRGTRWPALAWARDPAGLRPTGRAGTVGPDFLGTLVRHGRTDVATWMRLTPGADVEAGLMLRSDAAEPVAIGLRADGGPRLRVVLRIGDDRQVLGSVDASARSHRLSFRLHPATRVGVATAPGEQGGVRFALPAGARELVVGPYADGAARADGVGFDAFEYRGGPSAESSADGPR